MRRLLILVLFLVTHAIYAQRIVVAELFTSEGCSSCAEADELLEEMTGLASAENCAVIALSFHITYWDHLGWKDPYSKEAFTSRQKKYSQVLQTQQLYTPQVIVNGEREFAGSNPIAFRNALNEFKIKDMPFEITSSAMLDNRKIVINYNINRKPKNELLHAVLVEMHSKHEILRGENKNRTLKHYNIVREMQTLTLSPAGQLELELPDDMTPTNSAVILYIQHPRTMKIVGATEIGPDKFEKKP